LRVDELVAMNPFAPDVPFAPGEPLLLPYGMWSLNLSVRVTEPNPAERARNPIHVEGTAAPPDGVVVVEVVGTQGVPIAEQTVPVNMPGPDRHAPFSVDLAVPQNLVDEATLLRVRLSESTGGDEVRMPLILLPN
jgi:hypothetical protein